MAKNLKKPVGAMCVFLFSVVYYYRVYQRKGARGFHFGENGEKILVPFLLQFQSPLLLMMVFYPFIVVLNVPI